MKNLVQIAAKSISTLLVPPSGMLIILVLYSILFEPDKDKKIISISSALLLSFIVPILYFIYLRKKKIVSDNDATNREERVKPYIAGIFLTVIGFIISFFLFAPQICKLWFTYLTLSVLILIINKYWKISAHAIGITIPVCGFFYVFPKYYLVGAFIVIIVCGARIILKKHTVMQVISGAALAAFTTLFVLNF